MDRLTQARIAPVLDLCSPEPLRMGSGSGTEVIPKLAPEFNQFLRLAIRHPNSGAGSEEEKMFSDHTVHLTMKAVRLLELCEAEGLENINDLLHASICD